MKTLNQRKIRWIVREMEKDELSRYQIAKTQGISEVHAWRVYQRYRGLKNPRLLPCGRKPQSIPEEEQELVVGIGKTTGFGAVSIEKILAENGVKMPHNRIHRILRENGLAQK